MIEWKKIDGFENYSVSNTGLVRNDTTGKLLKTFNQSTGYKIVHLYKNGKMKNFKIHRLVALSFVPNANNEKCVNHKNGNKHDNRKENLEWCSYSQNNIHSYRFLGRSSSKAISAMTKAKLKSVVCIETGKVYESIKKAAEENRVYPGNISQCLSGKRNTAGNFHWGRM